MELLETSSVVQFVLIVPSSYIKELHGAPAGD